MIDLWEEKDILILVKAYPELSAKYTETVCVAGIMDEPRMLVRLYPVRFRYLDDSKKFIKYQWISAKIRNSLLDSRPESFNIETNSIVLKDMIPAGRDWSEREKWVLSCGNVFDSMEKLMDARESQNISLAIVKPKEFLSFQVEQKREEEIKKQDDRKQKIWSQPKLFEEAKDLELIEERFVLNFLCNDKRCKGHKISILDWEIAELYRKIKKRDSQEAAEKVEQKIIHEICGPNRDTYLIVGNIVAHQRTFCILGFFYPPKIRQQAFPF